MCCEKQPNLDSSSLLTDLCDFFSGEKLTYPSSALNFKFHTFSLCNKGSEYTVHNEEHRATCIEISNTLHVTALQTEEKSAKKDQLKKHLI